MNEEQGSSGSGGNQERDDREGEDCQPQKAIEQDSDQAGNGDDKQVVCQQVVCQACILYSCMITKLKQKHWEGQMNQRSMDLLRWNLLQPL